MKIPLDHKEINSLLNKFATDKIELLECQDNKLKVEVEAPISNIWAYLFPEISKCGKTIFIKIELNSSILQGFAKVANFFKIGAVDQIVKYSEGLVKKEEDDLLSISLDKIYEKYNVEITPQIENLSLENNNIIAQLSWVN
ncbi:hypothetical protein AAEX28_04950 [Lentisphaerota bacterium WC36G]|nr:hypothetical protein LJT99_07805 [Lentisphaerae bacterium WC36]